MACKSDQAVAVSNPISTDAYQHVQRGLAYAVRCALVSGVDPNARQPTRHVHDSFLVALLEQREVHLREDHRTDDVHLHCAHKHFGLRVRGQVVSFVLTDGQSHESSTGTRDGITHNGSIVIEDVDTPVLPKGGLDKRKRAPDRCLGGNVDRHDVQRALRVVHQRMKLIRAVGVSARRDDDVGWDGEQLLGELKTDSSVGTTVEGEGSTNVVARDERCTYPVSSQVVVFTMTRLVEE